MLFNIHTLNGMRGYSYLLGYSKVNAATGEGAFMYLQRRDSSFLSKYSIVCVAEISIWHLGQTCFEMGEAKSTYVAQAAFA